MHFVAINVESELSPRGLNEATGLALEVRGLQSCIKFLGGLTHAVMRIEREERTISLGFGHLFGVTQSTIVLKLPSAEQAAFQERLSREPFEFRTVPHAKISVKASGVSATLYKSGKLVIQGAEAQAFVDRFVGDELSQQVSSSKSSEREALSAVPTVTLIGSDECGKGDYFGPLVVCAVKLTPEIGFMLSHGKIADSKTLTDSTIKTLAGALRDHVPSALARLDPPEYNTRQAEVGNVNEILADLHAQAIRALYEPGIRVLVDRFAKESLMQERLQDLELELEQRPRAESNLAVAAASVLARDEFLTALEVLSAEHAVELRKGAGPPTDEAGREFIALHGEEALAQVAKVHFKNTTRICGEGI